MLHNIIPVVIIVLKKGNKYLLTKRVEADVSEFHDVWQLPGGAVEYKEKIIDALQREAKEELGIEINIVQLIPYIYDAIRSHWHGILICYLCTMKKEHDKIIINEEASEYQWCLPQEVKKLSTFPETYNIIQKVEGLL